MVEVELGALHVEYNISPKMIILVSYAAPEYLIVMIVMNYILEMLFAMSASHFTTQPMDKVVFHALAILLIVTSAQTTMVIVSIVLLVFLDIIQILQLPVKHAKILQQTA